MSNLRPSTRVITYATAVVWILVAVEAAASSTVNVSSCPGELLAALQDAAVTTVQLLNDCSLENTPDSKYVTLSRNVTIMGRPGNHTVLDLAFQHEVLNLCPGCWLRLSDLTLSRARKGTGDGFDSITGSETPGAVVLLQDVTRHRIACTLAKDAAAMLEETPRSTHLPNSTSGQQEFKMGTALYLDVAYPNSLLLNDVGTDIELSHVEGRVKVKQREGQQGHFGGFSLWEKNVTRVCEHFVTEQCLSEKPAEACVNDIIDAVDQGAAAAGKPAGSTPVVIVAVVVPVVVVGLFVVGLVVWCRRRHRLQAQQQLLPVHSHESDEKHQQRRPTNVSFTSSRRSGDHSGATRLSHADSANESAPKRKMSIDIRINQQGVRPPLGGQMSGWEVAGINTSPWMGEVQDLSVEFGEQLGAGSFGRVYKARWAGQDVAVKVIEHTEATFSAVAAEAELLLSLNHPNLVRAYHYVTYIKEQQHSQLASSTSISSSQGSRMKAAAEKETAPSAPATVAGWDQTSDSAMDKEQGTDTAPRSRPSGSLGAIGTPIAGERSPPPAGAVPAGLGALQLSAGSRSVAFSSRGSGGGQLERTTTCSSTWQQRPAKAETWLLQEYCDRGTLSGVAAAWAPATECEAQMLQRLQLLLDAANGLAALHTECVVHGDLNARNVLVSEDEASPIGMTAKVADLGLSKVMKNNTTHRTTNTVGTMSHTAPELMRYGRLAPSADVYSFGVMMWELFTNQVAFQKLHYGQFFETVVLQKLRPLIPPEMPADYMALMRKCWSDEPADRPSSKQVVECLATLVADRRARLAGRAADAARMAAFWALLGCQPPETAAAQGSAAGAFSFGSRAAIGSPVGSDCDRSWRGFVQNAEAAGISDTLPQVQGVDSSTATAASPGTMHVVSAAVGARHQADSLYHSRGAELDDKHSDLVSQEHLPSTEGMPQTSWFV